MRTFCLPQRERDRCLGDLHVDTYILIADNNHVANPDIYPRADASFELELPNLSANMMTAKLTSH